MSVGSALRYYYEYEKWKFTAIVIISAIAILTVGAIVCWYLFGAPAWQTFLDNFFGFFTMTGQDIYGSFADLQTYILGHWAEFLFLILFIGFFAGLIVVLVRIKKRHRVILTAVCTVGLILTGAGLVTSYAVNEGLLQNPFGGVISPDPVITHKYITVQFDGYFKGGDDLYPSQFQVTSVTVTEQITTGELDQVKHDFVGTPTWTLREDKGTGIVRVYAKIVFADGSEWGEEQLWQSSHAPNSQFDWTYRFDCPDGKDPVSFQLRITQLDYFWIWHYGYKEVYNNQWDLS